MEYYISLGISIAILISTFFVFSRFRRKTYSLKLALFISPLLFASFLYQQIPQPIFYLFPFLTLLFLFLILFLNAGKPVLIIGFFYILMATLLITNTVAWPFHIQLDHTIFSNKDISNAIFQHQQDAIYLPFRLRPLMFNDSIYIYFSLTHLANFLSLKNLCDIFLIVMLYPLILGLFKLVTKYSVEKIFILGSISITFMVIGFSRSVNEASALFVISPLFIYLILDGLEGMPTKYFLALLAVGLFIQTNIKI